MIDYDKRDMIGKIKYCNKEKKEKQILDKASGKLLGVVYMVESKIKYSRGIIKG